MSFFDDEQTRHNQHVARGVGLGPLWDSVESSGIAGIERDVILDIFGSLARWLREEGYRVVKSVEDEAGAA